MPLAVDLQDISHRFGTTVALDKVHLAVSRGTIHALVGENGAGKTTLMKILFGVLKPDEGSIEVEGVRTSFRDSKEANHAGIGMVSQHYGIIPGLTCLQNLILGAEGSYILNLKKSAERAQILADHMGFLFDWNADAESMSPSSAQKLEILKLLWRESRIMILDEPTAMLSPEDSNILFSKLRQLTSEGATAIVVTHRIGEVMQFCDEVTVLRGGKNTGGGLVQDQTSSSLATMIMGREIAGIDAIPEGHLEYGSETIIDCKDLVVADERGHLALNGISFEVRSGEVLGIAGVDGSGQRELIQAVAGIRLPVSGKLNLWGTDSTKLSPQMRIEKGLRVIAEDRLSEAVIEPWSLEWNGILGYQRTPEIEQGVTIDVGKRLALSTRIADKFGTRYSSMGQSISELSGGNQQRFVAGRALALRPSLIVAFQPARGLDIGTTIEVYKAIREACQAGASAIVISFDLDELRTYCDRIGVLFGGSLTFPPPTMSHNREVIGKLMVGLTV